MTEKDTLKKELLDQVKGGSRPIIDIVEQAGQTIQTAAKDMPPKTEEELRKLGGDLAGIASIQTGRPPRGG